MVAATTAVEGVLDLMVVVDIVVAEAAVVEVVAAITAVADGSNGGN